MGEMEERHDPSRIRISDADRHRVADVLRDAAGEGRLEIDELDERLEATWQARTYADLVPITADLPVHSAPAPGPARAPRHDTPAVPQTPSIAILSGAARKGVWTVGQQHTAVALCGGLDLDLREAVFSSRETVINVLAICGGVDIVVNARTHVVVDGVGIMGDFSQGRDRVEPDLGPDSPVVRVRGLALMAGVGVVRKPPRGHRKKLTR